MKINRILSIIGTVLIWISLLAPLILGIIVLIQSGEFHLDYWMPAELSGMVFLGAACLLGSASRTEPLNKPAFWTLVVSAVLLFGGQRIAVITGLANGDLPATGWQYFLVMSMIIGYDLGAVILGVLGIKIVSRAFQPVQREG